MKQILYIFSVLLLLGCEKELQPVQIAVSTGDATNITTNSASIQVSMDKNDLIDEIGVFCSTDSLFNSNTVNKSSTQTITGTHFNFQLSNLSDGTKYFYKAYASGKSNSIYGITKSFTTEQLQLSTSINNIEAGDQENTYSVKINSNTGWYASSNQSWCEVSPNTGTTNNTINILLKANTTTSARQAIVTVTAGNKEQKITINQKGCNENLSVSSNYFSISPENKSYNFIIYTNLSWEASSDQSWCVLSSSSGNGENTLSFTVSENTTNQERKAIVKVKSGSLTQEITIVQQSKSATLSVSTNTFSVNADRNTYNFSITSNIDWTITSDQSWCTPSIAAGSNNQTVSFVVSENTSTQERTAMISIKAGTLFQHITVTQTGTNQTLAVSKNSFLFGFETGHGEFTISSNTNWNISSDQSWCNVATTSGSNNKTISFSITENTSTQRRTAIITVETSSSSIQIVVTQEGKTEVLPNLSVSPESISVTANEQTSSFSIASNTNWTISSNQTWCTPSVTSGSGDKTVTCSISANTSSQSRTATMTVTAGDLSKTVTIEQEGKEVAIINIPDVNFKAYLVENFDTNKDGEISEEEASKVTFINCREKNISSLEGIEYFINVTYLDCALNNIQNIYLQKNTEINDLCCFGNKIQRLDLFPLNKMEQLRCHENALTELNIDNNVNLKFLSCGDNKLTSLNVRNNKDLTDLYCENMELSQLDLKNNSKLSILWCFNNHISNLDLSNNRMLTHVHCRNNGLNSIILNNNSLLTILNCEQNNLPSIDTKEIKNIESLYLNKNNISTIDVSQNKNIKALWIENNELSSIDVSNNLNLEWLDVSNNKLTYLHVNNNTNLKRLSFYNNKIGEINLHNNVNLEGLGCMNNLLTELDVSKNKKITDINCSQNNLTSIDVSNNLSIKELYFSNNPIETIYLKSGQTIESMTNGDYKIVYK
ncbi:MAG: hypothetical protein J6K31_01945 [Parabacteroides sp.]|nr:hypothetical protein [Parabacteroides sp.]